LQRWYNADGTSEWFKPNFSEPAIFLNPKHDCNELVVSLETKASDLCLKKVEHRRAVLEHTFRPELAIKLQSTMKHATPQTSPAQLLISYKSTPTSLAAHAVDEGVRSAVTLDVLHAVDSAVGQVFYSAVFEPVYKRTWCAIYATWANQTRDTS
jgi:hypothetical protein